MRLLFLLALCLIFPGSLFAAEPILTLAMVSYDSLPRHQYQTPKDHFPAGSSSNAATTVAPAEPSSREAADGNLPRVTLSLAKQQGPRPANPVLQTGKYLTERGHSKAWQHVQAGYGEIFSNKSPGTCGRNFEEPSCGYLKLCFPF